MELLILLGMFAICCIGVFLSWVEVYKDELKYIPNDKVIVDNLSLKEAKKEKIQIKK